MKHVSKISSEKMPAKGETVCGYLFTRSNTKCVDDSEPVASLLKTVPVP